MVIGRAQLLFDRMDLARAVEGLMAWITDHIQRTPTADLERTTPERIVEQGFRENRLSSVTLYGDDVLIEESAGDGGVRTRSFLVPFSGGGRQFEMRPESSLDRLPGDVLGSMLRLTFRSDQPTALSFNAWLAAVAGCLSDVEAQVARARPVLIAHAEARIAQRVRPAMPEPPAVPPPPPGPRPTLLEAGAEITAIELASPWEGKGTVSLGLDFPNRDGFRVQSATATLNGYVVKDVVCSFSNMLVYSAGRPIRETAYLVPDADLAKPPPDDAVVERIDSSETIVQPLTRAWSNHYHWIAQSLPAILAGTFGGKDSLLALPALTARQEETLRILGIQDYPRLPIRIGQAYRFRSLEVSDFVFGRSAFRLSRMVRNVFETMKGRVAPEAVGGKRLYLTQRTEGHRILLNDAELSALLARRGFQTVDPGDYSVTEQINLFRNARAIVAPHGAALTNIGFCQPGTVIYELIPNHYVNACFNRIAQLMELNYHADAFSGEEGGPAFQRSFGADLVRVVARLDMLGL